MQVSDGWKWERSSRGSYDTRISAELRSVQALVREVKRHITICTYWRCACHHEGLWDCVSGFQAALSIWWWTNRTPRRTTSAVTNSKRNWTWSIPTSSHNSNSTNLKYTVKSFMALFLFECFLNIYSFVFYVLIKCEIIYVCLCVVGASSISSRS